MPRKPNPPPDNAEQAARFVETAKLVEADSKEKFERAFEIIVPPPKEKKSKV